MGHLLRASRPVRTYCRPGVHLDCTASHQPLESVNVPDGHQPPSTAPKRAGWVLASLILVAAVANLNLAVANVALPDIGKHFDSGQTTLDLIAVGYSLGLACSVLWLGALGDRYGRKTMAIGGTILAVPFSLLAALSERSSSSPGSAADWRPAWHIRPRSP